MKHHCKGCVRAELLAEVVTSEQLGRDLVRMSKAACADLLEDVGPDQPRVLDVEVSFILATGLPGHINATVRF